MSILLTLSAFALNHATAPVPVCTDFLKSSLQKDGYICALHLDQGDIKDTHIYVTGNGNSEEHYYIRIIFSESGTKKIHIAQRRGVPYPIAIFVGKELLSEPIVSEIIEGNEMEISAGLSFQEAQEIVARLEKLK